MKFNYLLLTTLIPLSFTQQVLAHPRADGHAPAGVMYEHLHKKGEWMLGYNVQRINQDSGYYQGSDQASVESLGRYSMLTKEHEMYMHMLHFMYAPTDNLTLMLMPMYMSMDMTMDTNPNQVDSGHGDHGGAHDMHGAHSHGVDGWGDTVISASYRAFDNGKHQIITTLGLSAPTGDYKKYGSDGKPVHYGMQLGAGVWQAIPSVTYVYTEEKVKAGIQASTRQPLFDDLNDLGYYAGDQRSATAWLSYLWHPNFSTSARIQYSNTDSMQGHYKVGHNHSSPADIQGNYGGEQTFAGVGVNSIIPALGGIRAGVEFMTPINENLNGVQQRTDNIWNVSISKAF